MGVTQKDIAVELGVSRSMVGESLSGSPRISEQTRQRVLAAADRLGYRQDSNREARALIAKRYGRIVKTGIIAALIPRQEDQALRETPFFMPFVDGIEVEADRRDLDIYICTYRTGRRLPRLIADGGVEGIICVSSPPDAVEQLSKQSLPFVTLVQIHPGVNAIVPDNATGIDLAIRHLVELGHRRVAYIGFAPNHEPAATRFQAYTASLRSHGLPIYDDLLEATALGISVGEKATLSLLSRTNDFTAIVCSNDGLAMQVIPVLESRGLRVPQDVSVVGFDDISQGHHFEPALTSIAYDRHAMGRRAVELMCDLADKRSESGTESPQPPLVEVCPVHLSVRCTSGPPPDRRISSRLE